MECQLSSLWNVSMLILINFWRIFIWRICQPCFSVSPRSKYFFPLFSGTFIQLVGIGTRAWTWIRAWPFAPNGLGLINKCLTIFNCYNFRGTYPFSDDASFIGTIRQNIICIQIIFDSSQFEHNFELIIHCFLKLHLIKNSL